MPELPEVETIRRDLSARLLNKKISKINESSLLVNSLANQYEHACLLFIDCALVELPEIQELVGKI